MHYLYKITNTLNNKIYIGQSNKETERWRQHKYLSRQLYPIQYIHRAMVKYGVENFKYEVIACCLSKEYADETEKTLIDQYDSRNKKYGYNISPGGDIVWNSGLPKERQPMFGKHHKDESKKKISESNKGKIIIITEEQKRKMSDAHKGKTHSQETIEKISSSNQGICRSLETRNRMSQSKMGSKNKTGKFKYTEEQKLEIINLHLSGLSHDKIAIMYNYSSGTISNIIKRYKSNE